MKDRVPTYPGRVQLTPVPGQANTYDMVRADEPTQEGDPLCKATLLPDDVVSTLGLNVLSNPQVKDAFLLLSRLNAELGNEYVWQKYKKEKVADSGYTLGTVETTKVVGPNTSIISYGDSVSVSSTGEVIINNPMTVSGTVMGFNSTPIKGKFISGDYTGGVYYIAPNSVYSEYTVTVGSNTTWYGWESKAQKVIGYAATYQDLISYVNSPLSNAYPPSIDDGYTYTALGQLGNKVQISYGSYVGTGTYGSSNPNSLTFSFVPKFLVVYGESSANLSGNTAAGFFIYGAGMLQEQVFFNNGNAAYQVFTLTNSDTTLQWYIASNSEIYKTAANQLNQSGTKYFYVAEG